MDSGEERRRRRSYKIYVKMVKTVVLDVECTDTIDQIKAKIGAIEGIDKKQQELYFAGIHLENDNMLADYDIVNNSFVDLHVTDGIQICVKIPSVGKSIKLCVMNSQNVADIKAEIGEKGGIPPTEQILMHAGRQLKDNDIVSQCGLRNGKTLHVIVCPTDKLRLLIDVGGGRTINLEARCWYTVADIKQMIETSEGLPACTHVLMRAQYGGDVALQDTETLQSQHIRNNDILTLRSGRTVQFFVKTWQGKTLTMSMSSSEKIEGVMKRIERKLQLKDDIYYLQYKGRVLSAGDTLQSSKVESNCTIDIRFRNMWFAKENETER